MNPAMTASKTIPPTTPPAIAPVRVWKACGEGVGVLIGGAVGMGNAEVVAGWEISNTLISGTCDILFVKWVIWRSEATPAVRF